MSQNSGIIHINTQDLRSRKTWMLDHTLLHEGIPGHHLQYSLGLAPATPKFREFEVAHFSFNLNEFPSGEAFREGWAHYAEAMGKEMGFYCSLIQEFGFLHSDLLASMRMVVDTGLHAKGWTPDQATQYMLANSAIDSGAAAADVRECIAVPGRAMRFKIGALKFAKLRDKARRQLGARFDIRAFHDQALETGALPLPVLEAKITRWLASRT